MRSNRFSVIAGCLTLIAVALRFGWAASGQSANPIQVENARPGNSDWIITNPAGAREIEGYASDVSVNRGDDITFYVSTVDPSFTLQVFRIGWYGGLGGRSETQPVVLAGSLQPTPTPDPTTGIIECNWSASYTLTTSNPSDPTDWVSGLYLVKLTGASGKQQYITFVLRDDGRVSDLLFAESVDTWEAYNAWGGKSLYSYNSTSSIPAVKVSFNRPYDGALGTGQLLNYGLNMAAYLESLGYDVTYSTNVDTHSRASELLIHKGFLSIGHDEYWSLEMRQNVTAARDAGVNLAFFSADQIDWQIRFEPSAITGAANRTIVAYKELAATEDPDAANPSTYPLITTKFRLPHGNLLGQPEEELCGNQDNGADPVDGDIVVTNPSNWVFANTGLVNGGTIPGVLGYEVDDMEGNQPANTIQLAHSPYVLNGATHYSDMTVYQAPSGATVFSAGTIQWDWGVANVSPWSPIPSRVSQVAQQVTQNVLNEFINGSVATPTPTGSASASSTPTSAGSSATPTATPTPVISIISPLSGASVSGQVTVQLAIATKPSMTDPTTVWWTQLFVDGASVVSGYNNLVWNSTKAAPGPHQLKVNAYPYNSSTVIGTATVSVIVTSSATPTVTPTAAATPTATSTPSVTPSATSTPVVTPTATSTPVSTPTATSTTVATPTVTSTPLITPTATPTIGTTPTPTLTSTPTTVVTSTPTPISTATPIISIVAPANGSVVSGRVNVSVAISTTPSQTNPGSVWWTQLFADGIAVSSGYSSLSWNATNAMPGTHTLLVNAYPYNSSTVIGQSAISVTVGGSTAVPTVTPTPGPAVTITSPTTGSQVNGTVTVVLSIPSTPSQTNPNSVWWTNLYVDGKSITSGYNNLKWVSTTVPNGSHQLQVNAFAYGSSQAIGSSAVTVTVNNP